MKNKIRYLIGIVLLSLVFLSSANNSAFTEKTDLGKNHREAMPVSVPAASTGDDLDPVLPEYLYTDITSIEYDKGTSTSGNLESLKHKNDGDLLELTPYYDGLGQYYYNITFLFGVDLTFEDYPPDYWDMYLWLDVNAPNEADYAVKFERQSIYAGTTPVWESLKDSEDILVRTYGDPINLSCLFVERTFAFRLRDDGDLSSTTPKNISIDRMRLVLAHGGTMDLIVNGTVAELSMSHVVEAYYGTYAEEPVEQDDWWKEFSPNPRDYYPPVTQGVHITGMAGDNENPYKISRYYLELNVTVSHSRMFKITGVENITLGYWNCADHNCDTLMLSSFLWNYSDTVPEFDAREELTIPNQNAATRVRDFSYLDLDQFTLIALDGKSVEFKAKLISYFDDGSEIDNSLVLDYARVDLKGITYDCENYDYPTVRVSSDDSISDLGPFTFEANISSGYQGRTVRADPPPRVRLFNATGWSDGWKDMSLNGGTELWECTNFNALDYDEGVYTVVIEGADSEGCITKNITKITINNEDPQIAINQPEPMVEYDLRADGAVMLLNATLSDAEGDPYSDVSFKLFNNQGNNVTNWIPMTLIVPDTWVKNVTRNDLSGENSGIYTVKLRARDVRDFYETEIDVQLILPSTSTTPPPGDGGSSSSSNTGLELYIGLAIITCSMIGFIFCFGYILRQKKLKRKTLKGKEKDKLTKNFIICPFCFNKIKKDQETCSFCGAPLIKGAKEKAVPSVPVEMDEEKIDVSSEDVYHDNIFLQSSNILKIWIFDAKHKNKIYEETLDPSISEVEEKYVDLNTILETEYENHKFIEKSFEINNKTIYRYIYYSKNPVIIIILSGKKFDEDYAEFFKNTIKGINNNPKELKSDPFKLKQFLDEHILLYNSRNYGQLSGSVKNRVNEFFKNKKERKQILKDLKRLPDDTFFEFLTLYNKFTEELRFEKTRYMINNINFFTEGFD